MASAVTAKLDFGPDITGLLPRFWQGEGVGLRAAFTLTMTGEAVDPDAVTVIARYPGGAVLDPAPAVTREALGIYTFVVPASSAGKWEVEVACAAPDDARAVRYFVVAVPSGGTAVPAPVPAGGVVTVNGKPGPNPVLNAADVGAVATVNGQGPDADGNVQIPTGAGGTVSTVNGKAPNEGGAVELRAEDIPYTPPGPGNADRPVAQVLRDWRYHVANHKEGRTDAQALNAAIEAAYGTGTDDTGGTVYISGQRLILDAEVFVRHRVTVNGLAHGASAQFQSVYTSLPSCIVHDGTKLRMGFGSALMNLTVVGKDLYDRGALNTTAKGLLAAHAFAGNGITVGNGIGGGQEGNATDTRIHDVGVFGFDYCVFSNWASRTRFSQMLVEGNNGIWIANSKDLSMVSDVTAPMVIHWYTPNPTRWMVVSNVTNNGSGACRVTFSGPSAGTLSVNDFADNQWLLIDQVGGVPGAIGVFQITIIDSATVDLQGSHFSGAYTSGGRARPMVTWRRGAAFAADDTDGLTWVNCVSNNYMVGYYNRGADTDWVNCRAEGVQFNVPQHRGIYCAAGAGAVTFTGAGPSAFTHKVYTEIGHTGSLAVTGAKVPATTGASSIVHMGGQLHISGGNVGGTLTVGAGITACNIEGGRSGSLVVSGPPEGLRKITINGGQWGNAAGIRKMEQRRLDIHTRRTDGSSLRLARFEENYIELPNGIRWGAGAGSPEGVLAWPRGSKWSQSNGTVSGGLDWVKTTGAGSAFGWQHSTLIAPPVVLDAAVQAALDYAEAGASIIGRDELHPGAVFARSHSSGALALTQDVSGEWREVAADVPRFFGENGWLLFEPATANETANARAVGSPPTTWALGLPAGTAATWTPATINGIEGVILHVTGEVTTAGNITVSGAGTTVATGSAPGAQNEVWTTTFFAQVLTDDAAVTGAGTGLQVQTAAGTSLQASTPSWYSTRLDFARRSMPTALTLAATAGAVRFRTVFTGPAVGNVLDFEVFFGVHQTAEQSIPTLPVLPAAGTIGAASHGGDTFSCPFTGGEFTLRFTAAVYRTSPSGVDQVLVRRGPASDCYEIYIAAGTLSLRYRRVIASTPDTAVTLGNVVVGTPFTAVFKAASNGDLAGAIAQTGNTLQTQSGTAIGTTAELYAAVNCHVEMGDFLAQAGLPS